jgi:hypothetical protein
MLCNYGLEAPAAIRNSCSHDPILSPQRSAISHPLLATLTDAYEVVTWHMLGSFGIVPSDLTLLNE